MNRKRALGAQWKKIGVAAVLVATTVGLTNGIAVADTPAASQTAANCEMTRTGEYQKADPEKAGLDPAKLNDALTYASIMGSNSIKVFRHGCLLGSGLRDVLLERVPTDNWGQAKTITAIATGIAQGKGLVDIDAPIGRYLPADLGDAEHRAVTLRNLLNASSGVQLNQIRGLNLVGDQARAREFFTMPMAHKPGSYFEYDQVAPSVVTYVLQQVIDKREPGLDFQDWVQRELFDWLGIPKSAYFWQRDRSGNTTGYSQLWLRPLEFGRLGELMLNDGKFQGRQIVPAGFMRELRSPAPTNCGYGYYTWLNSCQPGDHQVNMSVPTRREDYKGVPWNQSAPADMYLTDGVGIRTWVIPSLDMVITRSGEQELDAVDEALTLNVDGIVPGSPGGPGEHKFFQKLMAAVTDMPDSVRETIANSGPYQPDPKYGLDLTHFIYPIDAPAGSYLGLGPGAAEGCNPLGCKGEPNDGLRWITDIPRTVPGIVGLEERPDGN